MDMFETAVNSAVSCQSYILYIHISIILVTRVEYFMASIKRRSSNIYYVYVNV